jgi:hypothetical protein
MTKLLPGKIANSISRLSNTTLTEISNTSLHPIDEYKKYIHKDNIATNCINILSLRAANLFGSYNHSNPKIQDFVRDMLADLAVPLDKVIAQLAGCLPYGFSVAEMEFVNYKRRLILKSIDVLKRDEISFRGRLGRIEEVIYMDNNRKFIPYWKCIHVSNTYADSDDPFGYPLAAIALPYIKSKMVTLQDLLVGIGTYSTGIPVFKLSPGKVRLYDELGNPRTRNGREITVDTGQAVVEQMQNLAVNKFLLLGKDDELSNFQVNDGSQLFNTALQYYDSAILMSFGVPRLLLENPSAMPDRGVATAINKQTNTLDSNISTVVQTIQRQLIRKAIKPVLIENFNENRDFGTFDVDKQTDPQLEIQVFANMMTAISMGVLNPQEASVQSRLRNILGLPSLSKEEQLKAVKKQMELQELQMQQSSEDPNAQYP